METLKIINYKRLIESEVKNSKKITTLYIYLC